jgi:hypothetical protein
LFLHECKAADKLPTIEDLTNGKVKIGDFIDKNNVDLVKEYLSLGVYESVKRGMVLRMGNQLPSEQFHPKIFQEATERHKGKAVIDENGTVYLKDGSIWPGGLPLLGAKTGLEIMANVKFGRCWDDMHASRQIRLINKNGKVYKTVKAITLQLAMTSRLINPPLGAFPGRENISEKRLSINHYPRNLRGMGNFIVRYYDDAKTPDTGFIYLPAFKKTMRFSTTNWQDNVAGSDVTWGDAHGLYEPFSDWKFKYIKTSHMLFPEPKSPFQLIEKYNINEKLKFDVGQKFPRLGWTIYPMQIVEAKCKHKHIYGKKILYTHVYPYWPSVNDLVCFDAFDRKMELWKLYVNPKGYHYILDGEPYVSNHGGLIYDLQVDHFTQALIDIKLNSSKYKSEDIKLDHLIRFGR